MRKICIKILDIALDDFLLNLFISLASMFSCTLFLSTYFIVCVNQKIITSCSKEYISYITTLQLLDSISPPQYSPLFRCPSYQDKPSLSENTQRAILFCQNLPSHYEILYFLCNFVGQALLSFIKKIKYFNILLVIYSWK